MNGKAAKRIREVSLIISDPRRVNHYHATVKRLKAEYKKCPYHKRKKQGVTIESHSATLRVQHGKGLDMNDLTT